MKKFLVILHILMFAKMVQAQEITVKDQATRQPLGMATVAGTSQNIVFTNANGKTNIQGYKSGDSVFINLFGYETFKTTYNQLAEKKFSVYLIPAQIALDEVVISANRWQQDKKDVPNRISTIRQRDIILQNPQTAADLLATSGEVYIQKSQLGGGSPMIRGFATNRVLIAVDGVRMNNAIFRAGNVQNVISLDAFAVEKTEVIFGPGSVMYGSDAIGGAMNFYTLTPKLSSTAKPIFQGNAAIRYASANFEKTGHLNFNIGLKKWSFLTSATFTDFDDQRMGSNGPDDYLRKEYVDNINGKDSVIENENTLIQKFSGYSQVNLMQKVRYKPNEKWDFNYGFHYSTSSHVPRYDRLIEYRKGKLRDGEWYYGPQTWMMNSLNAMHTGNYKVFDRFNATLALQNFGESRHSRTFGNVLKSHNTESVDAYSANLDFEKNLSEKHDVQYGTEVVLNTVGSVGEEENIETKTKQPAGTRYPNGSTWNSYAAYTTYRFKPGRKITLQAGARYNYVSMHSDFDTTFYPFPFTEAQLNNDAVTGSLGAAYKPGKNWQFNLNFSTGFRSPNVDDVGRVFDSEPGSVVVPNPGLIPEYAYNAEAGIEKVFGNFLKFNVTGFYTLLDNALVRRDFTLGGLDSIIYQGEMSKVQALQNAANAKVYGVQAGIDIKFPLGFGFSTRFNYQQGEEELEDGSIAPLRHAAPWFGISHITFNRNRLQADLYGVYNAEVTNKNLAPSEQAKTSLYAKDANGKPYSPAWYTLNFKAAYQLTDYFMLSAGLENITDVRYRPYSSGITAPGRNLILSARASF